MTDCPTFADALRTLWQDSGLRQDEFARALGYQRPTVANMLRGTHLPPLDFLVSVEAAFPGAGTELEPLLMEARAAREQAKAKRARVRQAEAGGTRLGPQPQVTHAAEAGAMDSNGRDDEMARFTRRRESGIDLSGTWYAVWETTVEGEPNINTEVLKLKHSGSAVTLENEDISPENPRGGYRWRGDCTLHDNTYLMGTYEALDPNHRQRGVLFYNLHRAGQFMVGRWVGCNYDSDLFDGLTVLARTQEDARTQFNKAYGKEVLQPASTSTGGNGSA